MRSEFNSEKYDDVLPRYMKKAKVEKTKSSVTKVVPNETNDDANNTCENCGKRFLRKRCLANIWNSAFQNSTNQAN